VSLRIFVQRHLTAQIPNAINQKFKSSWRLTRNLPYRLVYRTSPIVVVSGSLWPQNNVINHLYLSQSNIKVFLR
jgi:hypothetical protein